MMAMAQGALADQFLPVALGPADVGTVYALYLSALAAAPNPAAVRPDGPGFFDAVFGGGGEILGLETRDGLAAYGVLRPECGSELDRVGTKARVAPDASLRVLDGSAVQPQFWRLGLQRAIVNLRIERAGALGAAHVIAKASPGNLPSMRNLLKCGFQIVGLVRKPYGWRYVHHRQVAAVGANDCGGRWIEASRLDEARARFRAGEAAIACKGDDDGAPLLKFSPTRLP